MPTRANSIKLATILETGTKYFYDDYLVLTDNFKTLIEEIITALNMTKCDFCKSLNISKRTLYRWIYKNDIPTRTMFAKIFEVYSSYFKL